MIRDFSTTVSVFFGVVDFSGKADSDLALFYRVMDVASDGNGNLFVADAGNNCIRKVDSNGWVTTFAGNGNDDAGYANGDRLTARFNDPAGIAVGSDGTVYVADSGNDCIRKIDTNGTVTTLSTQCSNPRGLFVDETGRVVFADTDNNRICEISAAGITSVIAGSAERGYIDGTSSAARFDRPVDVASDTHGNIYVSDTNNDRIRKIDGSGNVSTWAGPSIGGIWLYDISGITVDADGTVYVVKHGSYGLVKITASGTASYFGGDWYYSSTGICMDRSGNIIFGDNIGIRKIDPGGNVTTIAGQQYSSGYADSGTLPAYLTAPVSICSDNAGNIIIADTYDYENNIRKIDKRGNIDTIGKIERPRGVAADQEGNVYITDSYSDCIYKMDSEGTLSLFAGCEGRDDGDHIDGPAAAATFYSPSGIVVDSAGNIFIADSGNNCIRKIDTNLIVSTYAGSGEEGFLDGSAEKAMFHFPRGLDIDGSGNLYVADYENSRVRKITPDGQVSTIAGNGDYSYYGDYDDNYQENVASDVYIGSPTDVLVDKLTGDVYVADDFADCIWVLRDNGMAFVLAGYKKCTEGYVEWIGGDEAFDYPSGMCFDEEGNILVADRYRHCIWKIEVEWGL